MTERMPVSVRLNSRTGKAFLVGEIFGRHELFGQRGFADTLTTEHQDSVRAGRRVFRRLVPAVHFLASRWTGSGNIADRQMIT